MTGSDKFPSERQQEILEVFNRAGSRGVPLTTGEIAEEVGCDPHIAHEDLEELAEDGELQTKPVSPDNRVWWVPSNSFRGLQPDESSGFEHVQFQELVREVSNYAIFILDEDGYIQTWNQGAKNLKGYSREEALGEHFSMLYTDEDQQAGRPTRNLRKAKRQGKVEDEGWRVRKDDSTFWANVTITALYDNDGDVKGFVKITRDMSDRHAHEAQLREEKERFQMLVREVKDYAIFMLDVDGIIQTWNEGAKNLKGFDRTEVVGEHFSMLYTEEARKSGSPEENLRKAAEQGRIEDEGPRRRKDGSTFWANVIITALYDENGEVRGFAKVTRDMTERHEYEQKLETQRKRLEFLNRIVRHNVLNGLNVVGTRTNLLQSRLSDDPEAREFLDTIERRVDDLVSLIETMRNFMARVVTEGDHEIEPVALRERLTSKVELARESYPQAEFSCHSFPSESEHVLADALIGEVFENVLSNAVLHNDMDHPQVEVWTSETTLEAQVDKETGELLPNHDTDPSRAGIEIDERPAIAVHIADNGPGISKQLKEEVFNGDFSGSAESQGGFGLYLVNQMMNAYGGSVTAHTHNTDTEMDDVGTVFDLTFIRADTVTDRENRTNTRP